MSDEDQPVGYCKPPKATRWKKGGPSPNPAGRPRKTKPERALSSRQLTRDIVHAMQKPVRVRKGTTFIEMPTIEALIAQATQQALSGDRVAARFLYRLYASEVQKLEEDRSRAIMFRELDYYELKAATGFLDPNERIQLERLRRSSREIL